MSETLESTVKKLKRENRILRADYAEQGESVATLRDMVRDLRKQLADLGARKFKRTKNGRVWG